MSIQASTVSVDWMRLNAPTPDAVRAGWHVPAMKIGTVHWWYAPRDRPDSWRPCHTVAEAAWRATRGDRVEMRNPSQPFDQSTAAYAAIMAMHECGVEVEGI